MLKTFKPILEANPDALIIINKSGKIVFANGQFKKLFGYCHDELQDMLMEQLMPERYRQRHQAHRIEYFHKPRIRPMGGELELYGLKKNGEEFPVEISLSPLESEEGSLAMAAVRDITKRKHLLALWKIEREYNLNQFNFISILEATPDALIIINKMGRIIFANHQVEKVFGYSRDKLQDISVEQLMPERYRQRHQSHRESYFRMPRFRPMGKGLELYGAKENGEEFPVEISLSPLESEEGCLAMATIRDVSTRKNQALLEMEREYNQKQTHFIAYLCHELRNPISGIQGSLNIIKEHLKKPPEPIQEQSALVPVMQNLVQASNVIAESLNDIDTCMEHIQAILDDSLIMTELKGRKLQLVNMPFDVKQVIYEVGRILQLKAKNKGLEIKLNVDIEKLWAMGDTLRIKQILFNLGNQAIQFTEKGHIKIALTVKEQTVEHIQFEIKVTDTSNGLEQQEISRLLEGSPQVSVGERYEESGFSLLIAKSLADLMGGSITLESTKEHGTTYCFTMQSDNLLEEERKSQEKTVKEAPIKPLTILVVDDNEINRKILKFNLEKAGHRCLLAADGLKAVAQYLEHSTSIDVILMDVLMPALDGIGATRKIRQLEKENEAGYRHVPIIGLSGNMLAMQQQEALDAGMDAYLTKPYKPEEIFQRIAVLLLAEQASLHPIAVTTPATIKSIDEDQVGKGNSQSRFWHKAPQEASTPAFKRRWMNEPYRNLLYPILDKLSAELQTFNVQVVMPEPKFQNKSSNTGWQLYTIAGKEENWAVLNLVQEKQADQLVAAIEQSGANLQPKKMKNGYVNALVIIFATSIALAAEIDKAKKQIASMLGNCQSERGGFNRESINNHFPV